MLVVVFHLAAAPYAIRCQSILEVIPQIGLRPVPQAPPWLAGTFMYHDELTPVVDLCQLIGGYACPARLSSRIILVRCVVGGGSARVAGLLAEQVTEARHIGASAVRSAPLGGAAYFGEVLIEDGSPLQMLDVDSILSGAGAAFVRPAPGRLAAGEADRSIPES